MAPMNAETMKVEVEAESCCVCGAAGEELWSPEEHDAAAPPADPPLRAVLLQLNHSKTVPSGRLCARCISKAQDAYSFSAALAARGPPPLSEKIRALRKRLHELSQKIDVFIVVGGGAHGAYSEEDIIMVEKEALAAAARADQQEAARARSLRGEPCFQCTVCPLTFQRAAEYRAHVDAHGEGGLHSCWTCGAQFPSHAQAAEHAREHEAGAERAPLACQLCRATFQSAWEQREHEAVCESRCPACEAVFESRGALRTHVAAAHESVCAVCLRVLASPAARAAHALEHVRARHYLCGYDGCILRFATRANLLSHLRKCHGDADTQGAAPAPAPAPAVRCDSCDRTFATHAAMRRHARVHLKGDEPQPLRAQEGMEWSAGGEEGEGQGDGQGEGEGEEYLEVETLEDMEHEEHVLP